MAQMRFKKVVIPSVLSEAERVLNALVAEAAAQGYSENARFGIRLAVDEAIANAIHHGNHGDPRRRVVIRYHIGPRTTRICVAD